MRCALFLLVSVLLNGCGVDSTRSMWSKPWTVRHESAVAYQARHVAEIGGKTLLTPATVTVDVVTDPLTWECALECARIALEACVQSSSCH